MNRKDFSAGLGVSRRQSWRLETGRIALLAADVPRIARVLRTTACALLGEHQAQQEQHADA